MTTNKNIITMDFLGLKNLQGSGKTKYLKRAPKTYLKARHPKVKNSKIAAQMNEMHQK